MVNKRLNTCDVPLKIEGEKRIPSMYLVLLLQLILVEDKISYISNPKVDNFLADAVFFYRLS
jgi:hypothetical protein